MLPTDWPDVRSQKLGLEYALSFVVQDVHHTSLRNREMLDCYSTQINMLRLTIGEVSSVHVPEVKKKNLK